MTSQTVTASVGNNTFSKIFTVSATDGQWDGNFMLDTLSSTNLGILIPRATINHVCVQYAGGNCAWRIQDAQTLQVKRRGWGAPAGYTDSAKCMIPPYQVQPNDVLVCFPQPVDATANQSNALSWVTTSKGTELYAANDVVDSTATEIKTAVNEQSLGDSAFGSTLQSLSVQVEDAGSLTQIKIFDSAGGLIYAAYGTVRGVSAGSTSAYFNLNIPALNIAIGKGWVYKIITVTG